MKKIISIVLILSFVLSSSLSAFALDKTNVSFNTGTDYDLIETVNEIVSSGYSTNTNTNQTSEASITILKDTDTFQEIKIAEGSKTNILSYDISNNKLYVDGNLVIVTEVIAPITSGNIETMALGSPTVQSYYKVSYGKQLVNLTVTALGAIISAACSTSGSIGVTLAKRIIAAAGQSSYLYCDATYCHSYKRVDNSYTFYNNYWDMYWDSSYSNFCASYYQTIYQ